MENSMHYWLAASRISPMETVVDTCNDRENGRGLQKSSWMPSQLVVHMISFTCIAGLPDYRVRVIQNFTCARSPLKTCTIPFPVNVSTASRNQHRNSMHKSSWNLERPNILRRRYAKPYILLQRLYHPLYYALRFMPADGGTVRRWFEFIKVWYLWKGYFQLLSAERYVMMSIWHQSLS